MTAQVSDTFLYGDVEYSLLGMTPGELATPGQFGMEPAIMHTGCYRGYYCTYELTEQGLLLRQLTLKERNARYLPIDGIEPTMEEFRATYYGLSVGVPFTGTITLAKDFIQGRYVHMGFQSRSAFRTVLLVELAGGRIARTADISADNAMPATPRA